MSLFTCSKPLIRWFDLAKDDFRICAFSESWFKRCLHFWKIQLRADKELKPQLISCSSCLNCRSKRALE